MIDMNEKLHHYGGTEILIYIVAMFLIGLCYTGGLLLAQNRYKVNVNDIEANYKEQQWFFVDNVFSIAYISAREKAVGTSAITETKIMQQYPNLSVLKQEIESNQIFGSKFATAVNDSMTKTDLFGLNNERTNSFLLLRDGYVFDGKCNTYGKTWHSFNEDTTTNHSSNYELLESMLGVDDNSILYSKTNGLPDERQTVILGSRDQLRSLLEKNGISGLENYQFYAYAYITLTGDIFGTPDVSSNQTKNHNHKMIVVQQFNLYDIINKNFTGYLSELEMAHQLARKQLDTSYTQELFMYLMLMTTNCIIFLILIFRAINKRLKDRIPNESSK